MNLRGPLYLGVCYLREHLVRTGLVVAAVTLSLVLPAGIWQVVDRAEAHLRARSAQTPLLLGARGSPLESVFNGIYFAEPGIDRITMADAHAAAGDGLAEAIPLYVRFEARGHRVVGTTLDYFQFRRLEIAEGRVFGRLGDCVLGAGVAESLGLGVGDTLTTTPDRVFDLAGVYPLKMHITGVLEATGTADDDAVFCDVKTTWIMEGLAHGHAEAEVDRDAVLRRDRDHVALNASILEYSQVTDENINSFHFHGDPTTFPITAAIVLPRDEKAETILLGRYVRGDRTLQLVRPDETMGTLFATVFRVRDIVIAVLVAVASSSLAIVAVVLVLTHRLREAEFRSLRLIGASPWAMRLLIAFEAAAVLGMSLVLSLAVLAGVRWASPGVIAWLM